MGMGATNIDGRLGSSIFKGGFAQPEFKHSVDIVDGGVMLAIPALVHCGLLNHIEKHFKLPKGYYNISSILLTLAFLALARVRSIEQLRYKAPGEWGKLLGLDRIPEPKILRKKTIVLAEGNKAKKWSLDLCNDWLKALPEGAAALYVDGHVRVYSGDKYNIPKHFVPRIKLCLHAACDYWVNAMDGQPFFMISQAIDPGLIKTVENEIVPHLEKSVPNQPSQEQLDANPRMSRFTVVFDREGYSPGLMLRLWKKRIAIKTYAKHAGENWPIEEFRDYTVQLPGGEEVTLQLAERGSQLIPKPKKEKKNEIKTQEPVIVVDEGNGDKTIPMKATKGKKPPQRKAKEKMEDEEEKKEEETLWVREIRKLNQDNSQTTIYTTEYHTTITQAALGMFARWCQENFFKYMKKHFGLDDLIAYSALDCPETVDIVNPAYRAIKGQLSKLSSQLSNRHAKLGKLDIPDIEPSTVDKALKKRSALRAEIEILQTKINELKEERKDIKRRILVKELSEEDKIKFLTNPSKQLIDTVKIVCYRAETAMALTLREKMSRKDDGRSLLQGIYKNEADLIPDYENKTLTVRLHHLANHASSKSIKHLCEELNKTETNFPGTELRLVYTIN